MTTWIFSVLALYLAQVYLSAALFLPSEGLLNHLGGRDSLPDKGKYTARADRALVNMKENLPFFLVPAVLVYVLPDANTSLALLGAQIFFWARLAYILAYLFGTPGPRSIAYVAGLVGNLVMVWALLG
ncbi:MAG: MAPEG family protein [Roseibium sp.]